ncbi:MAG: hypothetical protein GX151_14125 [Gammaproteobacteria bacterium]|jgi:hypothetical protein|nr:hypothetical protein [Gammaproteobacteria bacterium]
MKTKFKQSMCFAVVMSTLGLGLTGCGGLPSDALNIELLEEDTSNWWSGDQLTTVIRVRSTAAEDISIQNVEINNGGCRYGGRHNQSTQFPIRLSMGQFVRLELKNCDYQDVIQVDVETDKGFGSYKF